jgi:WD40 repeat protein
VGSGQAVEKKKGHEDRILAVAIGPDGKTIATSGRGAEEGIRLWAVDGGELRATLPGHGGAVGALVFSPDGRSLASGGYDRVVKLWEVEAGGD